MSSFEDLTGILPPDNPFRETPGIINKAVSYNRIPPDEIARLRKLLTDRKTIGVNPDSAVKTYDESKPTATVGMDESRGHTVRHDPQPKKFDNAVDWINFVLPDVQLHKWQFEALMELSGYQNRQYKEKTLYTDQNPYMSCLVCANGSGKDMLINAGFSTYFAIEARDNKVVVTSASADQLKYQTEVHIRRIAQSANKKCCYNLFNSIHFYHSVPELQSEIKLLATDEAGRAEGAHPYHGGRMVLIVNEAKSITEEIFGALSRCSGYSIWLNISSPGEPSGAFYNSFADGLDWPAIPTRPGQYQRRRITAYDCPHISLAHINNIIAMNGGIESPIVQSSVFANFVAELADIIIPIGLWNYTVPKISGLRRAGLDIGGGIDPTVLVIMCGNYVEDIEEMVEGDLARATDTMESWFRKHDLKDCTIWGDHNQVGHGPIDELRARGWRMRGITFQAAAENPQQYANLGAECWFNTKLFVQKKLLYKPTDPELLTELTSRYYKEKALGKRQLEDKKEHKKRNAGKSPNKADAYVMCWIGLKPNDFDWKPTMQEPDVSTIRPARLTTHDYYNWIMAQQAKPNPRQSLQTSYDRFFGGN